MASETVLHRIVRQAKIVGGDVHAYRGEFPYQVAIQDSNGIVCGGTILSTFFVLSAAHCLLGKNLLKLRVTAGIYDRYNRTTGSEQVRLLRYVQLHENYVQESQVNDIALLMLNAPLEFTSFVQNISLPRPDEEFEGYLTATGFGQLGSGGPPSRVLRKLTLPLVSNAECARNYSSVVARTKVKVTEDMLCAGEPGRDTCQGDSGGPGVCRRNADYDYDYGESLVLCGVITFGYGCGKPGFPGIYSKVSKYISWIQETERKLFRRGKCRTDQFYCDDSCKSREFLCDGWTDCKTLVEDDERACVSTNTTCRPHEFRCSNGRCVGQEALCDQVDNCWDRSDEDKCPPSIKKCLGAQHQCGGRCIPNQWKCDGHQDCEDNSDEERCSGTQAEVTTTASPSCRAGHFFCSPDQLCIMSSWRCDGDIDCLSGADEMHCPENVTDATTAPPTTSSDCSSSQFACQNGNCTWKIFQCDSEDDCGDWSDERNCTSASTSGSPTATASCTAEEFACVGDDRCIPLHWRCDGYAECPSGQDEVGCSGTDETTTTTTTQKPSRTTFPTTTPIPQATASRTEGVRGTVCSPSQFECASRECIFHSFRCDDDIDCQDGTDELNCTT